MGQKHRLFLTGSERAEFEHIHGPLTVDETDPRFVLVDDETEAKIAALPPGVPVRQGQHPADIAAIRQAELDEWGEGDPVQGGKGPVLAKALDLETGAESGEDAKTGEGESTPSNVANSGTPVKDSKK